MTFSLEKAILWTEDWKQSFELKTVLICFLQTQIFTSQDINAGPESGDYLWIIVIFLIICLDFDSDGTHSLQRIHYCASDVMLNFAKYVQMKKLILDGLRVSIFSANFHFWMNYSFTLLGVNDFNTEENVNMHDKCVSTGALH